MSLISKQKSTTVVEKQLYKWIHPEYSDKKTEAVVSSSYICINVYIYIYIHLYIYSYWKQQLLFFCLNILGESICIVVFPPQS